ncbi:GNAT family acetyltransferase [Planococcus halocryophilus Or1]|uniref:GNAT family N-acetyltransferase n=1 Tax=Planococcus halocryophilus TaxID=1215089 RepID=A0A1C7DNZ7_9BACL|nr:GNAT family protein [Planococcus halocryophilus]ANU13132.1 GNAT family N-acetyltransferase [Planococcus halocryophilus]EMF47938.1 GNAT family acetyltransferase [Planococcus halocryophilus Or1]
MIIRKVVPADAEQLVALMKHVEESNHMLFEPGERKTTSEQLQKRLLTMDEKSTVFVAEEKNELTGYVFVIGEDVKRKQHSVYIAIGVQQYVRGRGTGTELLRAMEKWAIERALHRIELTVIAHNKTAVALYEKMGFNIEGVKRDSLYINSEFVNEYYMSKLI